MPGTYFYVDGLNLYYGALRGTAFKWLDLGALARVIVPHDHIGLIRYFSANVKPHHAGDRAPERQNAYLRALAGRSGVHVVKGQFRNDVRARALALEPNPFRPPLRPDRVVRLMLRDGLARSTKGAVLVRVRTPEEKGSDVNLGCHLVRDAVKRTCDKAIVVTNDSDLVEPIRMAVEEGIEVGLLNPHRGPTNKRLRQVATFDVRLRPDVLAHCQLPDPVLTSAGKKVHKPVEW